MPKGDKFKYEKATNEVMAKRIEEAALYLLEHPDSSYTDFVRVFGNKWNLQRAQCNIYRKKALKEVGKASAENIDSAKRLASASLKQLLKKAMDSDEPNLELALKIRQELNKVTGAHAPIRTEVTKKKDASIFKIEQSEVDKLDTDEEKE